MYPYVIPRCPPIASYGSSPGPKYKLPGLIGYKNHDYRSIHHKGSAWVFGIKTGKFYDDCSPGPKYEPGSQTRFGGNGNPVYSLYGRPRDPSSFKTPGAGSYSPESHCATYHKAPVISFGSRSKSRRTDDTPGPNRYILPNMTGGTSVKKSAPCYSLSGRSKTGSFHEDLSKTPGPGTYKTTGFDSYKGREPHFSMTGRNVLPGDTTQKPGPGAHSPENVTINKRKPASSSFGIRHSEYTAPLIVEINDC